MLDTPVLPPAEKLCTGCGETRPTSQFYRDKSRPDGLFQYCRLCGRARGKADRSRNVNRAKEAPFEKECRSCSETKPTSLFAQDETRKDGLRNFCKVCVAVKAKAHRRKYPLCRVVSSSKSTAKKGGYTPMNITRIELERFAKMHDGVCDFPGCSAPATQTDHCHEVGYMRGRLCRRHNTGLGCFKDSAQELRDAASYIEECERAHKEKTLTS